MFFAHVTIYVHGILKKYSDITGKRKKEKSINKMERKEGEKIYIYK